MKHTPHKILIADDDPTIVDAIKIVLETEGYSVITATDRDTIIKAAKKLPDLILLDIWMSGHDGRDICKKLKSQSSTKHIPIIMISANKDTKAMAKAAGADDCLDKPFEIEDLLEKVEKYILY